MPRVSFYLIRLSFQNGKVLYFSTCALCKSSEDKYLYLLDNKNMLFILTWGIKQIFVELCFGCLQKVSLYYSIHIFNFCSLFKKL